MEKKEEGLCSVCGCSCRSDGKKPCQACRCCCGGTKATNDSKGAKEQPTGNTGDEDIDLTGYDSSQDPKYDPNSWWEEELNASGPEDEDEDVESKGDDGQGSGEADEKDKGKEVLDEEKVNHDLEAVVQGLSRFGIKLSDLKHIEKKKEKSKKKTTATTSAME